MERYLVKSTINQCAWNNWEAWDDTTGTIPYRVALFGDPQIMDNHSYPDRHWLINRITRLILDSYHKKNWRYIQKDLNPDASMFLGDLFDGGRYWDDKTWIEEFERFNRIFPKKRDHKFVASLPGNHDIGFGDTVVESSYNRFETYFGETSSIMDLGNHTFVLVDTISMSDSKIPHISQKVYDFLDRVESYRTQSAFPRILLTHVPLYRIPDTQTCGFERESTKLFPMMKGDQYQTVIDQQRSSVVLSKVDPKLIFSGDDHDYCHVTHEFEVSYKNEKAIHSAEEITTKSSAMNMGIKKPAVHLLSLYNPLYSYVTKETKTYENFVCYLPDPYKPLFCYAIAALLTLFYVILICFAPRFYNRNLIKSNRKESILPTFNNNSKKNPFICGYRDALYSFKVDENKSFMTFLSNSTILTGIILLMLWYYFSR
ncbi:related to Cell division control protein 1 [Saccharomycodes ludwigii]|uniref:Related to Cell division control protein 1 n=2 Tax=Saccharomycodes ludwigii TaxID=36035 RepID=A0A376B857_9ASCO|nr:related to Cell division control protein 1 [Saccharomycodes ludwigii]